MRLLITFLFVNCALLNFAQELNCNVFVDGSQIQTQEVQIFEEMQAAIQEFMNNTRWTEDEFEPQERIDCNLSIQLLTQPSTGNFTATAQVQSTRPIYNTDYNSVLLNFIDKEFYFTYQQGTQLDYGDNQFTSDLTSLCAFYAYVIIGLDYSSFSEQGGAPYFEKVQNIFLTAQSSGGSIWENQDDPNSKFSLGSDLINTQLEQFHKDYYNYHLKSLDKFTTNPEECLNGVINVLENIKEQRKYVTYSVWINTFFLSKRTELVKLFENAPSDLKSKAKSLLMELDPKNRREYETSLR